MSCLNGNVLLNLVFELKFLDVFMVREDPIESDIFLISMEFVCCNCFSRLIVLLG